MRGSLLSRLYLVAALSVVLALVVTACGGDPAVEGPRVNAVAAVTPFEDPTCSATFVAHDLPHLTSGPGDTASTFDGTGAGLAAGDLDGDGDIDLVIANLSGASTILENLGAADRWRAHDLVVGRFRGVAAVDIDADDDLDIVMSTGIGPPVAFVNNAAPGQAIDAANFDRTLLDDVRSATYSFAFGDLGGDGDLDLVTGSYNAELTILRNSPVLGSDTGVKLYEATSSGYDEQLLSPDAQALALVLTDVDGDGATDIVVGNDLATADFVWLDRGGLVWEPTAPFSTTSYSTMSYDAADLDGDGRTELFTTDMARLPTEPPEWWVEVDADMAAAPQPDDIQAPRNVLSVRDGETWVDVGQTRGVATTGWSWSGLFGDLDNDGAQDLFVVNGMRSDLLFDFLPEARLVEPNQVFRNLGDRFEAAPDWALNDTAGGRGAVVVDLDNDGDLDIAINNLDEPARVFENQLCTGNALTVDLRWPGSSNPNALDAVVFVEGARQQTRTMTSARGYLSATAPVVHFGLGSDSLVDVTVRWPDGAVSHLDDVALGHVRITRTSQE